MMMHDQESQPGSAGRVNGGLLATRPYAAYRDSGVDELGVVPAHWEVRRVKNSFGINLFALPEDTEPDYRFHYIDIGSVGTGRLVSDPIALRFEAAPSRARRVVRRGDTLVSTVRTYLKAVWHVEADVRDLVASTGFAVLTPKPLIFPRFASYACRSEPFTTGVTSESVGVVYPAIAESRLASILQLCVPPMHEQRAIVRFLDHADRRIRRYIRAKERLIELLEERKRALIHEAVTGRIDVRTGQPYPAYKDSGVEWLGQVPKHWDVVQLGRLAVKRCDGPFGSGLKSSHYTDGGVRVVRLQNIGHGEFRNHDPVFISAEHYSTLGDHSVEPDDVLIAGLGDRNHPAGRACVAPRDIGPTMVKADCFRFRLHRSQALPRFVALQLTATALGAAGLSRGATRQRINLSGTAGRRITLPVIKEQLSILEYVTQEIASTSMLQDNQRCQIALLREYRTRLIADVVTGKLDVREAAADLPETDPLARNREQADTIPTESNLHSTTHDMSKEAIP